MKTALLALLAVVVLLVVVVLVRTAGFRNEPVPVAPEPGVAVRPGAAERLAGALRIPTVSPEDPGDFDGAAFAALHDYLRAHFPAVHAALGREVVGGYSLLYTWPGSDASLDPILLMGHLDVVPVEPGTEERWTHPPFAGAIADGFVWGRGALDDKPSVLGTLEAVEALLGEGFRPRRTIHLAYGHDEEVGGDAGARAIAALLRSRDVRLAMVLDEGGVIGDGLLAGLSAPTALVGVAEKGYLSVELTARAGGGHSSMPPSRGAIGALSAAITRLERNPMPARLDGPALALFRTVGPELPFARRAVLANLWLTRPLVLRQLEATPSTNAMIRTTAAATIFEAGTKSNVLPGRARAVVNVRILPGDSVAGVVAHLRRVVDGTGVEVRALDGAWEPSPLSSTESEAYRAIERAIRRSVPNAVVAPFLVVGATDARHYRDLGENVYRFLPVHVTPTDLERLHGTDERIAVEDYARAIGFYQRLIREFGG